MAGRDYESTPVSDSLNLRQVITGLAGDIESLRAGKLSPSQALAHAALAKQVFNGVRLYLQAIRSIEQDARPAALSKANGESGE